MPCWSAPNLTRRWSTRRRAIRPICRKSPWAGAAPTSPTPPRQGDELFLHRAGEARDIVLDEKEIEHHHRHRTQQRRRHERAPVIDVAFDQLGDRPDRERLVLRPRNEGGRI